MKAKRNRSRDRLRALLHQRFSQGPHNVLSEMRRPHGSPSRISDKGNDAEEMLQGLLQRSLTSSLRGLSPGGGGGGSGGFDIDNIVAGALMEGPRTASVLRTLFNLVPNLIGR